MTIFLLERDNDIRGLWIIQEFHCFKDAETDLA